MIHPAGAGNVEGFSAYRQLTGRRHSREGIIMGGLAGLSAFSADSGSSMDDGRFIRRQLELKRHVAFRRAQCVTVYSGFRPFGPPLVDPDQ